MFLRPAMLILCLLPLCFLACTDSATNPTPEEPLPPAYSIQQGTGGGGVLIGWAQMDANPYEDRDSYGGRYHLSGDPFRSRIDYEFTREADALVHNFRIGRPGEGPSLETTSAREDGGAWAWCLDGWGELGLIHDLVGQHAEPVLLDPLCPMSYALLGWHWRGAGDPTTLTMNLLLVEDPAAAPLALQADLIYEGEESSEGIELRSFRLELGEKDIYFKLMLQRFPIVYRAWWEGEDLSLVFWGDSPPNTADLEFAPDFPDPNDYPEYSTEALAITGPLTNLAGELFLPASDGPFPGVLMISGDGPADRDDAALFGHLAHGLAMSGRVVLRYDKPGTGNSSGLLDELDLDARRENIAAAWAMLRGHAAVDPEACVMMGHGEGAALALEFGAGLTVDFGVIALAPPLYDPLGIPGIPEAELAAGDYIYFLGRSLFVGKHKDLLDFDSAEFLPDLNGPVAFFFGQEDERISDDDFQTQLDLIATSSATLTHQSLSLLSHQFNAGRPDEAPAIELTDALLAWLDLNYPEN